MRAYSLDLHGKQVFGLRTKLPSLGTVSSSWCELAYEGEWKGHQSGSFSFTPAKLQSIVDNFDKAADNLPVYYGHPRHDLGLPIPAAGWIRKLELRTSRKGTELWGQVEWTEDAAAGIRKGEYKYCSVVVDFRPTDRVTGEPSGLAMMYELGLTGSPFLPGMTQISLSRVGTPNAYQWRLSQMDPKQLVEIGKALGLPETATEAEIKTAFESLFGAPEKAETEVEVEAACAPAEKTKLAATDPEAVAEGEPAKQEVAETASTTILKTLADATGLSEEAILSALSEKIDAIAAILVAGPQAMSAASNTDVALSAHQARGVALAREVTELRSTVAALSAERESRLAVETAARVALSFNTLKEEGRVTEEQRSMFLKASAKDEAGTLEIYQSLPAIKPPTGALAVGLSASPVKAPGVTNEGTPLDDNDNEVKILRLSARGQGLKGVHVDAWVRRALNLKSASNV